MSLTSGQMKTSQSLPLISSTCTTQSLSNFCRLQKLFPTQSHYRPQHTDFIQDSGQKPLKTLQERTYRLLTVVTNNDWGKRNQRESEHGFMRPLKRIPV